MAKKQKQKLKNKKEGRHKTKQKKVQTQEKVQKAQSKTPSTSHAVTQSLGKIQRLSMKKRKFPLLATLYLVFMFGILFALMTTFSLLFDLGDAGTTQRVVQTTQKKIDPVQVMVDDVLKTEALNGVLYEPQTMFYPIAVMFDNHSLARPQSHLQSASVVYETLVEGSITRFMGIFDHGDLDKIGPVRSSRPYFVQWADAIDAAYVHAGGSPEALQKIREYSVKDITRGQYYYRDFTRPGPHNLYTDSKLLKLALRDFEWADYPQTFSRWQFKNSPRHGTLIDGKAVDLKFSGNALGSLVRWEFVPELGVYKRFQAGVSHEDTSTAGQLKAKTIIVQVIPEIVAYQDKGRLVLDIFGEGKAHVLFDGKRIEGIWKRANVTERTTFYDENDEEVIFPRGTIFVEVIPSDREVTFE